jgi:Tfp pilus assembly protein PilF
MKRIIIISLLLISVLEVGCVADFKISQISLSGMSLSHVDLAQQYLKEKDYIRTIAHLNKATALNPNSFIAHIFLSLADTYYLFNNFPLALEEYEIALSYATNDSEQKYIKEKIEELKAKK